MQNETIFSDLVKITGTKRDLTVLLEEIAALKASVYKTDSTAFSTILRDKVRKKISDVLTSYIEKQKIVKQGDLEAFLNKLEGDLKKVPFVEITIAIEPTGAMSDKVVAWVRELSPGSIVDFQVDRNIIAGAIITNAGKYYDGSVARKLEEYLNGQI